MASTIDEITIDYTDENGHTEELLGKDPLKISDLGVYLSFVLFNPNRGFVLIGFLDEEGRRTRM